MLIRRAKLSDAKFIYSVVNISRKKGYFTNTKILDYKDHIAWFKNKLDLKKDIIYLAYHNKNNLGYLRFDFISKKTFEISLALLPKYFAKNFGSKLLIYSLSRLKKNFNTLKIFAKVKKNNERSQIFFIKSGFKKTRYSKKIFKKLIGHNKYVFYKLKIK